jgi:predicted RNase H-like nuclease (RuvC/YqgF family)
MNDHIPDVTKMIGDTPISDSTPHNVAELGMLCRRLERELNAASGNVERLTKSNLQLREGCEEQKQRIKRLEEALEARASDNELNQAWELYIKTKEAKL